METMRQSWTDERLDDMKQQMEAGFNRIDQDIRSLQRAMIYGVVALSSSFIAGFAALIGLFATQL
ncbi:MAG TPA: hypothetical protein VIS95_03650 [Solirubrobacterales bacterium]